MAAKTVADKLLIKPGTALWSSDPARTAVVGALPESATVVASPVNAAIALVFAGGAAPLRQVLDEHGDALRRLATIWIAYPKGNRADINRDTL